MRDALLLPAEPRGSAPQLAKPDWGPPPPGLRAGPQRPLAYARYRRVCWSRLARAASSVAGVLFFYGVPCRGQAPSSPGDVSFLARTFADGASDVTIRHPLRFETRAIRGVTVGPIESSLWPGRGYGSPHSAALLDYLQSQGVNWISITPFGRIWSLTSTEIFLDFEQPFADNREAVGRFVDQAHARGMRVLLVPHLWVWNESGWRGEIDPGSDAAWARYQQSYENFVLTWAEVAREHNVDALSIGVECKSWSGRFGGFWTSFIAHVREKYSGLLTYSANWDEAPNVLFWDQLDFIGINAFYPLADHNDASTAEYLEGARRNANRVREVVDVVRKPVLFVEVGYTTRRNAAVEPWLWPEQLRGPEISDYEQSRALLASLRAFVPEPWFAGFFVWRYYANLDDVSQEPRYGFSPHGKQTEALLSDIVRSEFGYDEAGALPFSVATAFGARATVRTTLR